MGKAKYEFLIDNSKVADLFFKGLYESKKLMKVQRKEKARLKRAKEEANPHSLAFQALVAEVEEVNFFETDHAKWKLEMIQIKWLQTNSGCTTSPCAQPLSNWHSKKTSPSSKARMREL